MVIFGLKINKNNPCNCLDCGLIYKQLKKTFEERNTMTKLINDLDNLRTGKIKEISINGHTIKHARFNRFYILKDKALRILSEWDLILKLTERKAA